MEDKVLEKVEKEATRCLEQLSKLKPGSEDYKATLDAVQHLQTMRLDDTKVEPDYAAKREKTQLDAGRADEELRLKEAEEKRMAERERLERRRDLLRIGVDVGMALLNLGFFAIQIRKGYKFEENGTYTSTTFREARQKMGLFRKKG